MSKIIRAVCHFLSSYASPFVIASAIVAFFLPVAFGWVHGNVSSVILGIIMLSMGLTLSVQDFKILFKRPLDILLGAVAQYTIMPLVAFTLTKVFGLDPYLAVGIVLVGCCPGGVSSNIMSFLAKGDVAYSVGMTTVSTLLAPIMTPLLVLWLADTSINVNAVGMFLNILYVTILPVTIGFLLNVFLGHRAVFKEIQSNMPAVGVIGLMLIVGGVVVTVRPQLFEHGLSLIFLVLAVVFCHNALGYVLGYSVGRLFKFNTAKKRTIAIEVGVQNAGMATVLAASFFANPENLALHPEAALCVVPCALSCIYHSISGTVLANFFAWKDSKAE
ncbi:MULTISPECIES: bile acid:sodium symporter family protein [Fibrobacter]|uniref:bile acid:sodium symporter family protein n=1 Tax=Fibrobacter TaxID=832 RepID=UPI001563D768|nr:MULTISPECIES: bile acid:sodium symporter family protein [Fibrobacter]MBR4784747.1 bile acid:sodium symporter family protein [Fibrobacter sp.]